MHTRSRSVRSFMMMLTMVPLAAAGCATDSPDSPDSLDSLDSDDGISTVESELGEAGCETANKSEDGTWGFESVSAGNQYDPAGCPDQYLVGWGSLPVGQGAFANVFWESTAPTASSCDNSHLSIACYSESLSSWTITSKQVFDGVWTGSSCTFALSSGPFTCPLNGDQKNRTAAKAWVRTCSGGTCTVTKRKVGVRAWKS